MEEKNIVLNKIDHNQEMFHKAIGVGQEEVVNCVKQIGARHRILRTLLEELRLSTDEILQTTKEMTANNLQMSKAIANLWKKRDRKQITLRECVGTNILLWKMIKELRKEDIKRYSRRRISITIVRISRGSRIEDYVV